MNSKVSLEKMLHSYDALISILAIFTMITIILLLTNLITEKTYDGSRKFNKTFGNEIFFTGPMLLILAFLIREYFVFKENPINSVLFRKLSVSESMFSKGVILSIILIAIFSFFMLLYIGGIFSDNPPENNITTIMSFLVIVVFVIGSAIIYNYYKNKDEKTMSSISISKDIMDAVKLREKYTIIFAVFAFSITMLYFLNPFGIMTDYGGPVMFITLFVGMLMIAMITIYQTYIENPSKDSILNKLDWFMSFIFKSLALLGGVGISIGLLYWTLQSFGVFDFDATSPKSWGSVLINFISLAIVFGIIYRLFDIGKFLETNKYFSLIVNTLLYIPCLLMYLFYFISSFFPKEYSFPSKDFTFKEFILTPSTPFEKQILMLSLALLGGYFAWVVSGRYFRTQYLKQGGIQLINNPIQTDKLTNITSYQALSKSDTFSYQYAISFWFYLDSFPPSTNSSYNKLVSLLSYGGNPAIKYSSEKNTLFITVKETNSVNPDTDTVADTSSDTVENTSEDELTSEKLIEYTHSKQNITEDIEKVKLLTFGNEVDSNGNRIIYKHPKVQLQKWNHVLLNYNGGTLDVFYNGKLVKTVIGVVPYMKNDMLTVGTENGVSGNIANLMYFDTPLDVVTINTLYVELKDKKVPSIPHIKEQIIPIEAVTATKDINKNDFK